MTKERHPFASSDSEARRRSQRWMWIIVGTAIAVTAFAAVVAFWMYWLAGMAAGTPSS